MGTDEVQAFRKLIRKYEQLASMQVKRSTTCNGVSLAQCHTLLALEENQVCSLNTLSTAMKLEKSTVSRTIEGLVKIGLVIRKENSKNRRETLLSLSKQGQVTVDEINRENNGFYNMVLMGMPDEKRDCFINGMVDFVTAFEKVVETNEEEKCCK